jgi:CheY-like chemotaxis protein
VRTLIVEDDESIVEAIVGAGARGGFDPGITSVGTMEDAIVEIRNRPYDLIVCDLRIPPSRGGVPAREHGIAVYEQARVIRPGTPIILFTAFGTLAFAGERIAREPQGHPTGSLARPMVVFFEKDNLPGCVAEIRDIATAMVRVDGIQLEYATPKLVLSADEKRVIRLAASRLGGTFVRCSELTGGLAGSRVFDLELRTGDNAFAGRLAGKVAPVADIQSEHDRFEVHVPPRLPAAAYAPFALTTTEGCGATGGIFYRLAEAYPMNLFQVAMRDMPLAIKAVQNVRDALRPWVQGAPIGPRLVRDIRRQFLEDRRLSDEVTRQLGARRWQDAESREIQVKRASQHGDMHGANILVSPAGAAMLIDFTRVDTFTSVCDVVTLELSVLFHPQGLELREGVSREDLAGWMTGDYAQGRRLEALARECRNWSKAVASAEGEIAANAYGYAVRQLAFEDTDKPNALAVIDSSLGVLLR